MGSSATDLELPPADSPSLVLAKATEAERLRTWSKTHPLWGPALSREDYLAREAYLTTVPLAKDGGITHWILTDARAPPDARPIYSSCESLRKPALAAYRVKKQGEGGGEAVKVEDGLAHGVGSVFTDEKYRGRGYAGRMMQEMGRALRTWQAGTRAGASGPHGCGCGSGNGGVVAVSDGKEEEEEEEEAPEGTRCLFSILYSDIGKKFYASRGWAPFASTHLSFPPAAAAAATAKDNAAADSQAAAATNGSSSNGTTELRARPIGYHELAELCAVDERQLRASLARRAARRGSGKTTHVALVPNLDQMLWHLMREDFVTKHVFGRTPAVRGAVYGAPGRRLWAVWTRGYYGGLERVEGNTLHVLRFAVEGWREEGGDPAIDDDDDDDDDHDHESCRGEGGDYEYLAAGMRAIVRLAQAEAAEWRSADVQMWNPPPALRRAVDLAGLEHEVVERDKDSIASLMWYGKQGRTEELDWVLNEKYGWC
ncbi:uncharacterized protein E0L32_000537 [Thyridium curvatum]|uniref:LYC1 C-terminal domain-containing protein n=1 Tax=Thyridium curvatum TaxID=1093900 RepID=A0A507B2Q8_9PEZI|nr:uncharacterized protein E0L32_000537 [Thyridium curvatum]TPX14143.1 hypothetical protein E0L32_000537 [Thyridium curvatum]